jgi:hypothetical protein
VQPPAQPSPPVQSPSPNPKIVPSNIFALKSALRCKSAFCWLTTSVAAPGAFTVKKAGKLVKSSTRVVAAGNVSIPVTLTSTAKKKLRRSGRLSVKVSVTFTPTGGLARSHSVTLSYKVKKK